jgi:hypothetical protein
LAVRRVCARHQRIIQREQVGKVLSVEGLWGGRPGAVLGGKEAGEERRGGGGRRSRSKEEEEEERRGGTKRSRRRKEEVTVVVEGRRETGRECVTT